MKRLLLFIILLGGSFCASAQQDRYFNPDYPSIEKQVKDPNSAFYYEPLFNRYKANDTTLTLREYRMLYYGYIFHENYSSLPLKDNTEQLKKLISQKGPTKADWLNVISMEKELVRHAPFDMRELNVIYVAYSEIGDSANAYIYHDKIRKIAQTILSTGDGKTEATAMHVISVTHEYDMLGILGLTFAGSQQLTDNHCDFLKIAGNEYHLDGLYFDVKEIFRSYSKLFDKEIQ